jgi:anti-sigma factor RsiW
MLHPEDATLLAWRAGELTAPERKEVEVHLADCERCARAVASLDALLLPSRLGSEPSLFQVRRMQRELDQALDRTISAQRFYWAPPKVAAALVFAVFSGAAAAMTAAGIGPFASMVAEPKQAPAVKTAQKHTPVQEPTDTTSDVPTPEEPSPESAQNKSQDDDVDEREGTALAEAKARPMNEKRRLTKVAIVPNRPDPSSALAESKDVPQKDVAPGRSREIAIQADILSARQAARAGREQALKEGPASRLWVDVGDLFALSGQSQDALDAYVQALAGPRADTAEQRLEALVADDKWRAP